MQTPDDTERYMVTRRGGRMALRIHELRVFDCLADAVEYAKAQPSPGCMRVFVASSTKRVKEINWYGVY